MFLGRVFSIFLLINKHKSYFLMAIISPPMTTIHNSIDVVRESLRHSLIQHIIKRVLDNSVDDNHDSEDNCVLSNVSVKEVFQAIIILNNYFLKHEKKSYIYTKCGACSTKKKKKIKRGDWIQFRKKKKQTTLYAYICKEFNLDDWSCKKNKIL